MVLLMHPDETAVLNRHPVLFWEFCNQGLVQQIQTILGKRSLNNLYMFKVQTVILLNLIVVTLVVCLPQIGTMKEFRHDIMPG